MAWDAKPIAEAVGPNIDISGCLLFAIGPAVNFSAFRSGVHFIVFIPIFRMYITLATEDLQQYSFERYAHKRLEWDTLFQSVFQVATQARSPAKMALDARRPKS